VELRLVTPREPAWDLVSAFLAEHADPVDDLLALADLNPPLGQISTVWMGLQGEALVALAFAFPLWPVRPALGVLAPNLGHERAVILALGQVGPSQGYVICAPAQVPFWASAGMAAVGHEEWQLVLRRADWQPGETGNCRPAMLGELERFYGEHDAGAWHPLQFETGPYVVSEHEGTIVAAAGTHFAYRGLAQVGNVLTAPLQRGRGLAAHTTRAVIESLFAQGHDTISLFVVSSNLAALRVYERLGFQLHRKLAAFEWSRQPAKQAL
jgi:ribosomal protein S18 acetylase RimI-like enzyme